MKTYFAFLCMILSIRSTTATVQTSFSQDKPTRIYIKNNSESISSSTTRHDSIPDPIFLGAITSMDETFTYNVSFNWNDNSGGNYMRTTHDVASNNGDYPFYQIVDWNINTSWPQGTEFDTSTVTESGGSPGVSNFVYSNQPPPISYGRYDINADLSDGWETESGWGEDYVKVHTTTQHTLQSTLILQTGGKAFSKLRNLFGLTVSATYMNPPEETANTPPWDNDNQWGPQYYTSGIIGWDGADILPSNIFIGTYGSLNSAGVKYVSLPDNANVDVTPYVAGAANYTFNVQPQKYFSYLDLYVQQANPGFSLFFSNPTNDVGHAFWRFRTDAPSDALQYISADLRSFLNIPWGFYPSGGLFTVPGQLQNDSGHPNNISRSFYIGFPDLINGLEYTKGISNAPPVYVLTAFNCVGAAREAGFEADVFGLPWDESPQNFGVTLIEMYPAPGQIIGPFIDTTNTFYSSAPY